MLRNLTLEQRALAAYMSQLSEKAHAAAWVAGLEHELWRAVIEGPSRLGRIEITQEHIDTLRELSEACGGWIVFDDVQEELFVPLSVWEDTVEVVKSAPPSEKPIFWMRVEDTFSIGNRGVVLVGKLEGGIAKIGDRVSISSPTRSFISEIAGIEIFRKLLTSAKPGDTVSILLRSFDQGVIDSGYVVASSDETGKIGRQFGSLAVRGWATSPTAEMPRWMIIAGAIAGGLLAALVTHFLR